MDRSGPSNVGSLSVRRGLLLCVLAFSAAGCHLSSPAARGTGDISIERSPTPFATVTDGQVVASVPEGWQPVAFGPVDGNSLGFYASPDPGRWIRGRAPVEGMAVRWVDETRVGVPSDFYYLAAMEPAAPSLTRGTDCQLLHRQILLDHVPGFMSGQVGSPGDYAVKEQGTCSRSGSILRWEDFVAAPGFGRIRRLGITGSGLYEVIAVVRNGPGATETLRHLVGGATFGGTSVTAFVAAARG